MKTILVIEDDPDMVEVVRMVLESRDFTVHSARNGTEGLRKVKEINPDLIILDVMMDELTEGFQVSFKLKNKAADSEFASYAKIPILMMTAIDRETHMRFNPDTDDGSLPVEAFMEKPIRPHILVAKVHSLLNMEPASE